MSNMTTAESATTPDPAPAAAPTTPVRLKEQRSLFATPLLTFSIEGHEDLNRRLLVDIEALRKASPGIHSSNQHGWHSERDFFVRTEASFVELKRHLFTALSGAVSLLNPKTQHSKMQMQAQGWVNVSAKGAFNSPHDHPHYLLSGVYYVRVPEREVGGRSRSGDIEFLDSRGLSLQAKQQELYLGNAKVRMRPQTGTMLIFPATLVHWVYPHEEDEERVSIAFNLRVQPKAAEKS